MSSAVRETRRVSGSPKPRYATPKTTESIELADCRRFNYLDHRKIRARSGGRRARQSVRFRIARDVGIIQGESLSRDGDPVFAANVANPSRAMPARVAAPAFLFSLLFLFFPLSAKRESSTSWVDYGVILPRHSGICRGRVLCRATAPIVLSRFHARPRNPSHPRKWLEFSCLGFMFHFRAALFLPLREFPTNPERASANKG